MKNFRFTVINGIFRAHYAVSMNQGCSPSEKMSQKFECLEAAIGESWVVALSNCRFFRFDSGRYVRFRFNFDFHCSATPPPIYVNFGLRLSQ